MKSNKLWRRVILIVVAVNLLALVAAQAQTARQIAQSSFPAVVLLVMEDTNRQPLGLGSGFFVREDVIATNLHVIDGAVTGYAKLVGQGKKYDLAGVVGLDEARDLVLLAVTGARAPSLLLGDSREVAVGDEVYVVGNPLGLEGTFSQGIVSSIRQVGSDTLLQVTAPISPGSSGGPVLNAQGKVIGIALATFKGGQNLNFAIPVSYLKPLVSNIRPATPLSRRLISRRPQSILADLGDRGTEGVVVSQLKWSKWGFLSGSQFYSFSLRNQLREAVKDVHYLVVFYDKDENLIHFDNYLSKGIIPGGLATRIENTMRDDVLRLTERLEFRVLDFRIAE